MVAEIAVFNGYVTIAEFLWTLLGVLWAVGGIRNIREARQDLVALYALRRNGYVRSIAITTLHNEWLRMGIFLIEILIGVFAMTQPPTNPDEPVTPLSYIILLGLFGINIFAGMQSYLTRRLRKTLLQYDGRDNGTNS